MSDKLIEVLQTQIESQQWIIKRLLLILEKQAKQDNDTWDAIRQQMPIYVPRVDDVPEA